MWELEQVQQCRKCPWLKGVDPSTIPNGYSLEKHRALECTIASTGDILPDSTVRIMACHESHQNRCIGWLHNQLGRGKNIGLCLQATRCSNIKDISLAGEQHESFEDTIPKGGK